MPFALLSIVVLNQSSNISWSLGILVLSSGVGSGTNRAIASVPIGGQTLALVLTLVGTPVAYSLFDDWSTKKPLRRLLGRMIGRKAA